MPSPTEEEEEEAWHDNNNSTTTLRKKRRNKFPSRVCKPKHLSATVIIYWKEAEGTEEEISLFPFGEFPLTKKAHKEKNTLKKGQTLLSLKNLSRKTQFPSLFYAGETRHPLLLSNPTPLPFPALQTSPGGWKWKRPPLPPSHLLSLSRPCLNARRIRERKRGVLASCVKPGLPRKEGVMQVFFCSTYMWEQVFSQFNQMRRKNDCAKTKDIIIV